MAIENWGSEFPWEVRKRAAAIGGELAAYAADFVLQCSRVQAGGAVCSASHAYLPSMCQRYLKLRPQAEQDLLALVSAHRGVLRALAEHRRGERNGNLRAARQRHDQALQNLFQGLREVA
ncbi:MAG TPA: hypothetical protein VEA40_15640 [Ramlibacter sp.]|nr:hypothetical protein [Ramlibacter sp.]